jgi:hypothetical protein
LRFVLDLIGVLGWDDKSSTELASLGRLGKYKQSSDKSAEEGGIHVRVVFIFPTLTSKETIATEIARSVSICNFSLTTLEHLLLLAMESIYNSENVIFGEAAS